MSKTISRVDFIELMADAAMRLPVTRKRKPEDDPSEFIDLFDYDAMSNEWSKGVQWLRGVGDSGTYKVPTPDGTFKRVPMRTIAEMPAFIQEIVTEAQTHLNIDSIVEIA